MKLYPVVHINDPEVAVEQAGIALDVTGVAGVYLIDHHDPDSDWTFWVFNEVTKGHPDAYIGVNLLAFSPLFALKSLRYCRESGTISRVPNGLWVDDIKNSWSVTPQEVMRFKEGDPVLNNIRILGGIAFKYTDTYSDDPTEVADEVRELESAVDVVTTSGSGTGTSPSVEKMRAVRGATKKTVAIASGVDSDNIEDYQGLVDEILVASSIETTPGSGVFDMGKLQNLVSLAQRL